MDKRNTYQLDRGTRPRESKHEGSQENREAVDAHQDEPLQPEWTRIGRLLGNQLLSNGDRNLALRIRPLRGNVNITRLLSSIQRKPAEAGAGAPGTAAHAPKALAQDYVNIDTYPKVKAFEHLHRSFIGLWAHNPSDATTLVRKMEEKDTFLIYAERLGPLAQKEIALTLLAMDDALNEMILQAPIGPDGVRRIKGLSWVKGDPLASVVTPFTFRRSWWEFYAKYEPSQRKRRPRRRPKPPAQNTKPSLPAETRSKSTAASVVSGIEKEAGQRGQQLGRKAKATTSVDQYSEVDIPTIGLSSADLINELAELVLKEGPRAAGAMAAAGLLSAFIDWVATLYELGAAAQETHRRSYFVGMRLGLQVARWPSSITIIAKSRAQLPGSQLEKWIHGNWYTEYAWVRQIRFAVPAGGDVQGDMRRGLDEVCKRLDLLLAWADLEFVGRLEHAGYLQTDATQELYKVRLELHERVLTAGIQRALDAARER